MELFSAYPTTTVVSITYANETKKAKSNTKTTSNDDKKASNSVKFKVYEPRSGKCLKYKTYKTKELSKLLTFLGPKGVTLTQSTSKSPKKRSLPVNNNNDPVDETNDTNDKKKVKYDNHLPGLASVMSNKTFETESAPVPETVEPTGDNKEASVEPETSSKNKKKKKKKGKK